MRQILIADAVVDREHPVLFRQGDLDGACGIYALMMGLNLCGYVDDETSLPMSRTAAPNSANSTSSLRTIRPFSAAAPISRT